MLHYEGSTSSILFPGAGGEGYISSPVRLLTLSVGICLVTLGHGVSICQPVSALSLGSVQPDNYALFLVPFPPSDRTDQSPTPRFFILSIYLFCPPKTPQKQSRTHETKSKATYAYIPKPPPSVVLEFVRETKDQAWDEFAYQKRVVGIVGLMDCSGLDLVPSVKSQVWMTRP